MTSSPYWICEVLNKIRYRVFSSFEEMAEICWYDWSCDDLDSFKKQYYMSTDVPALVSKSGKESFILKDFDCLEKFYKASIENIRTNPADSSDE